MRVLLISRAMAVVFALGGLAPAAFAAEEAPRFMCPMHPHYVDDHEGNCPVCGMALVALERKPQAQGAAVQVDAQMVQSMGVRTAAVALEKFGREVRAFGRITASPRLETVVASRVEGWVQALAVTAEGDAVTTGAVLYEVYSPQLVSAQRDYLAGLSSGTSGRADSARQRLKSLGMQAGTIDRLRRTRRQIENVPVVAEAPGVVAMLAVREGAYVKPGDTLMRLQGYSRVWVMASLAEQELGDVATGQTARMTFPAIPGAPRQGAVDYVYPTVDPTTRTGQVRIVVDNPDALLKPGAYVDVVLTIDRRERLAVPGEAILRDSRGAHVIVALGGGRFAPRAVETGVSAAGNTEILTGLAAG
ncbi:MAG: efflux RND transporter periplasmic adaptor subunit, partial [Pseudomonadota bacterium]